jgi:hypothetical protein
MSYALSRIISAHSCTHRQQGTDPAPNCVPCEIRTGRTRRLDGLQPRRIVTAEDLTAEAIDDAESA